MNLDHFAELVRLAGLALANHFGIGLKHAQDLVFGTCFTVKDAGARLLHRLLHARDHGIELLFGFPQDRLTGLAGLFDKGGRDLLCLAHDTARGFQQLAVGRLHLRLAFLILVAGGIGNRQYVTLYAFGAVP